MTRRHRPEKRFYDEAARRPFLIQRVCSYLRTDGECSLCPLREETPYGMGSRMCRLLAIELIAVVAEDLELPSDLVEQDNVR